MVLPLATIEIIGSRECNLSVDDPWQDLLFTATGSDDEAVIRWQIEQDLTPVIQVQSAFFGTRTLVIQSYRVEHKGNQVWEGKAHYGRRQPRQTGDIIMTFDGVGGTQHISVNPTAITTAFSAAGQGFTAVNGDGLAPNFNGAIGVNNNTVAGTDITVPVQKLTFEYYPSVDGMTPEYIRTLMTLIGTNDAPFMGFDTGEVLYVGTAGQPRSLDDWQLLMHFIASANIENLTIGQILNIVKGGWDYLWVQFANATDHVYGIKTPMFAYVETVYNPVDFSQLGIGVDFTQVLNIAGSPGLSLNVANAANPNNLVFDNFNPVVP
jgi:hypothetical protein